MTRRREKIFVVIAAAGEGIRLGYKESKALVPIGGRSMVQWSLEVFNEVQDIDVICITLPTLLLKHKFEEILSHIILKKQVILVEGGKIRQDSVLQGIQALDPFSGDIVLVHDAARPFVSKELIETVIACVRKYRIAIPALPVTDTLKKVEGNYILKTLDRETMKAVQTPQGFVYRLYEKAIQNLDVKNKLYTDEAMLFESAGNKVRIVEGDKFNIKITYPEDLLIAEAIVRIVERREYGRR
jgi:2-C-methyl-D-erythritol 4-phosphate cytidylyltransferase